MLMVSILPPRGTVHRSPLLESLRNSAQPQRFPNSVSWSHACTVPRAHGQRRRTPKPSDQVRGRPESNALLQGDRRTRACLARGPRGRTRAVFRHLPGADGREGAPSGAGRPGRNGRGQVREQHIPAQTNYALSGNSCFSRLREWTAGGCKDTRGRYRRNSSWASVSGEVAAESPPVPRPPGANQGRRRSEQAPQSRRGWARLPHTCGHVEDQGTDPSRSP